MHSRKKAGPPVGMDCVRFLTGSALSSHRPPAQPVPSSPTITGFISMFRMEPSSASMRETATSTAERAAISAGGFPLKPLQHRRALTSAIMSRAVFSSIGRHPDRCLAEKLHEDAAEPENARRDRIPCPASRPRSPRNLTGPFSGRASALPPCGLSPVSRLPRP